MKIKLTQEQADYLETFYEADKAIYYISRWGWCYGLEDGYGNVYEDDETPFEESEKLKMLDALINGYEVIEPKFRFYKCSDDGGITHLYYAGHAVRLMSDKKLAKELVKDSEEYKALVTLGFFEEEV